MLLEGGRAAAVEFRQGERTLLARAACEIVLAAGSIQSPQLLELSGIGDANLLGRHGIAVNKHLPGVGENLRDHLQARIMFEVRGLESLNDILPSFWKNTKMALRYALFRNGMMSAPGATAHAYARTDGASTQPDIELQLHHLSSPDERNPARIVLDDFPGFSIGVVLAARAVLEKAKQLAAAALDAAAEDVEFRDGFFRVRGTDHAIEFDALNARHSGAASHPLDLDFEGKFGATYPNGCHVAEVEIDPQTGEAQVVAYVACDDVVNVVNAAIVEGQLHGGIVQGAGQVFGEQAIYDAQSGQLLSGSFMDYAMPRAGIVCEPYLVACPVPTQANPLGAKGAGEAGTTGSLSALKNAVLDALRSGGVKHFDMPATPARIWRTLDEK